MSITTNPAQFGTVARTTGLGSTTVSSSSPRFLVSGASLIYPYVGMAVHKMGQFTGWSTGDVTQGMDPGAGMNTCIDVFDEGSDTDGRIIGSLCQAVADYGNAGGDSGASVFTWDGSGSHIELVGIHAGALGASAVFSPWLYVSWEVESEVGGWEIAF